MRTRTRLRRISLAIVLLICLAASAAPPTIARLSSYSLRSGATDLIKVHGSGLGGSPRLILSKSKFTFKLKKANDKEATFEVTLPKDTGGVLPIRVSTAEGISNPALVVCDSLATHSFDVVDEVKEYPVALGGSISGSAVLKKKIHGKKGQRLSIEVEARRLGANWNPVVRLYDARGSQIAWSANRRDLENDARTDIVIPADGVYQLEIHDLLYRAQAPSHFRVKLGELAGADLIFPLGVQRGLTARCSTITSDNKVGQPVDVLSHVIGELRVEDWSGSGVPPRFMASDHPELIEQSFTGSQKIGAAPIAVSGIIALKNEFDEYLVDVSPNQKLRFEVFAQRLGSKLDGIVSIHATDGRELGRNDDQANTSDPRLDYTVPKGMSQLRVRVNDLHGSFGMRHIYRLAVSIIDQPNFELSVADDRLSIPSGSTQVVRVTAKRTNFDGEIPILVDNLPAGVTLSGNRIAANRTSAVMTIRAGSEGKGHSIVRLVGEAEAGGRIVRRAASNTSPMSRELARTIAFAVTPSTGVSLQVHLDPTKAVAGLPLPVTAKVTGAKGDKRKLRLRLQSTQPMPKKKVKRNKKDVTVDDIEKALRIGKAETINAAGGELAFAVLIPPNLKNDPWDFVIEGEILAEDNKTVVGRLASQTFTVNATGALQVSVTGSKQISAVTGIGESGELKGSIKRMGGHNLPVKITLAGLPKEYKAPSVTVPASKSDFVLPVRFEFGRKPAKLEKIKLVASASHGEVKGQITAEAAGIVVDLKQGKEPPKPKKEKKEKKS